MVFVNYLLASSFSSQGSSQKDCDGVDSKIESGGSGKIIKVDTVMRFLASLNPVGYVG